MIHHKFVLADKTVNPAFYMQVLKHLCNCTTYATWIV